MHERLGDYEKARASFLRGEQPGMARRMDDLLAAAASPFAFGFAPRARTAARAFHDLAREKTLVGNPHRGA